MSIGRAPASFHRPKTPAALAALRDRWPGCRGLWRRGAPLTADHLPLPTAPTALQLAAAEVPGRVGVHRTRTACLAGTGRRRVRNELRAGRGSGVDAELAGVAAGPHSPTTVFVAPARPSQEDRS